jgi:hypothetical protein
MKQYVTKPLELRRRDSRIWDSIDYKCIAILDNRDATREAICKEKLL